ncbi:MAG: acetyl-CoA hydrolase [Alphaproteobacteria bacterium]|nr:acetyl-CoA hydrolase [Alphaproteobacteria bacterium]
MKPVSPKAAIARIAEIGGTVTLPGATAEATALIDAWRDEPEHAAGLVFRGLFVPGLNETDYAGLHASARMQTIFATRAARPSFQDGKVDLLPLCYTQAHDWLEGTPCDVGIVHGAPGPGGTLSASVCADAARAIFTSARYKIALINSVAPRVDDPSRTPLFPLQDFDLIVETGAPLVTLPPESKNAVIDVVAAQAARLIEDGDALQFGIGKLPAAILAQLSARRRLRIRSGMFIDAVMDLLDADALDPDAPMIGGAAIGSSALHARMAEEPRARFAPVPLTHGLAAVSQTENFVALNGALQVDLFGQVNSEWIGAQRVSGLGGLPDFVRAATAAPNGRAIIALPAQQNGESRILARLSAPCITLPAREAQIFVTEHGAADVRGLSIDARAAAIIAIAAPERRADLADAWDAIRRAM